MKFPTPEEIRQARERIKGGVPPDAWPDIYKAIHAAGIDLDTYSAEACEFALGILVGLAIEEERGTWDEVVELAQEIRRGANARLKATKILSLLARSPREALEEK